MRQFAPSTVLGIAFISLALAAVAQDAPHPSGTYEGDGLSLTFTPAEGGQFTGTVSLGDKKFPLTAAPAGAGGGTLKGTFDAGGSAFPFTLKTDGTGGATFESDGNVYKLKRRSNNPLATRTKPNPLAAGPAKKPAPVATPPPPVDPLLGTFAGEDGVTVTISGGSGGVYDVVVNDAGDKTSLKLKSAGEKGYTGEMVEDGEKTAVTATLDRDVLKVSAGGEKMEFRRKGAPASAADAPPPANAPPPPGGVRDAPPPPKAPAEPRAAQGTGVWLKPLYVADDRMLKTNAIQFLAPDGWGITGGIGWRQHPQYPAYFDFVIRSADGTCAITYFPDDPCFWFPQGDATFPPGSSYLGSRVATPMSPAEYIRAKFGAARPGARFGEPQDLPKVAAACLEAYGNAPGIRAEMRAARMRMTFDLHGASYEEDVYCVMEYVSFDAAGKAMMGWKPNVIYSFRAPAGTLDSRTPLMQMIASSLKPELPWVNKYLQLKEVLQKQGMDAIAEAGKRSKIVSQLNDDILKIRREVYENEQKAFQKANDAWCDYIGGMQNTVNPQTGQSISAPAGATVYQKGGSYYYTFDPNDPNAQAQGMTRVGG